MIGSTLTNLAVEQNGLTTVQVTWTELPGSSTTMHQIMVTTPSGGTGTTPQQSPYTFNVTELGVYTVQEVFTSQHYPNRDTMVTVEGKGQRVLYVLFWCFCTWPYYTARRIVV